MRTIALLPLLVALGAGGCVAPSAPPPAPAPQTRTPRPPVVTTPPPLADTGVAPGIWTLRQDARGSLALFGAAGQDALLTLRCDRAQRRVFLSMRGATGGAMTLRATTGAKTVTAVPTTGAPIAYVAAELAATDPILDALAFSRGRFSIELAGAQLGIPAWPEFTRVVEDCRG